MVSTWMYGSKVASLSALNVDRCGMGTTSDEARGEEVCLATRLKVCVWPRVANKATLIRSECNPSDDAGLETKKTDQCGHWSGGLGTGL
jgi:hypothetical protein